MQEQIEDIDLFVSAMFRSVPRFTVQLHKRSLCKLQSVYDLNTNRGMHGRQTSTPCKVAAAQNQSVRWQAILEMPPSLLVIVCYSDSFDFVQ